MDMAVPRRCTLAVRSPVAKGMDMADALTIRAMTRDEMGLLVEWAGREGWRPGLHDADIFWANDPDAFIAAEWRGEVIGGGAITSYGGQFGFMGFFIVRPEFRGRGFGDQLWHARRDRLRARLRPGASIGMDGVFQMQEYYAKGGFVLSHRTLRFSPEHRSVPAAPPDRDGAIVALAEFPFAAVAAYDRTCFPAPRDGFLRAWITQPDSLAVGCRRNGQLAGYAVIRRCDVGARIGPWFADDARAAEALYRAVAGFAPDGPLYVDVPENNAAAMGLVERWGLAPGFGCARMYLGPPPAIRHDRVFGVSSFELG